MSKYKIAFVCIGNSCRSQMAEGFAEEFARDIFEIYSAGTEPAPEVKPNAVKAMAEVGIDISDQYPKNLDQIPGELDILITMGCGVSCPFIPCQFREDWGLEDPAGKPLPEFRRIRDLIEDKVKDLIKKVTDGEILN